MVDGLAGRASHVVSFRRVADEAKARGYRLIVQSAQNDPAAQDTVRQMRSTGAPAACSGDM